MDNRKGFTLLEIVITLGIFAILASVITLSASEMRSTARANKVINDLYAWKSAVHAWYFANTDLVKDGKIYDRASNNHKEFNTDSTINGEKLINEVAKYLDINSVNLVNYNLRSNEINGYYRWFVSYNFPQDPTIVKSLRRKLIARAPGAGLLDTRTEVENQPYKGTNDYLYIMVMDFNN